METFLLEYGASFGNFIEFFTCNGNWWMTVFCIRFLTSFLETTSRQSRPKIVTPSKETTRVRHSNSFRSFFISFERSRNYFLRRASHETSPTESNDKPWLRNRGSVSRTTISLTLIRGRARTFNPGARRGWWKRTPWNLSTEVRTVSIIPDDSTVARVS